MAGRNTPQNGGWFFGLLRRLVPGGHQAQNPAGATRLLRRHVPRPLPRLKRTAADRDDNGTAAPAHSNVTVGRQRTRRRKYLQQQEDEQLKAALEDAADQQAQAAGYADSDFDSGDTTLIASAAPTPNPSRPSTASRLQRSDSGDHNDGTDLDASFMASPKAAPSGASEASSPTAIASTFLGGLFSPVLAMFTADGPSPPSSPSMPPAKRTKPLQRVTITVPAKDLHEGDSNEHHYLTQQLDPSILEFLRCPGELPPLGSQQHLLPPSLYPARPTLVLDLDETLVHSKLNESGPCTKQFVVQFRGDALSVYVHLRPHAREFLTRVADLFEVVVFTASQSLYANDLLDWLDPEGTLIHHRLFREHCTQVEGLYVKDLRRLGRDLSRTAIVDNSPQVFAYQLNNGIPIPSWFNDNDDDRELLKVLEFLESAANQMNRAEAPADMRKLVKDRYSLHNLFRA